MGREGDKVGYTGPKSVNNHISLMMLFTEIVAKIPSSGLDYNSTKTPLRSLSPKESTWHASTLGNGIPVK